MFWFFTQNLLHTHCRVKERWKENIKPENRPPIEKQSTQEKNDVDDETKNNK